MNLNPFTKIAEMASGAFGKRTERKINQDTITGELAKAKVDGAHQISLSEKQWEMLSKQAEAGTWKDEFITVTVMSIFIIIILGAIASAFGFPQILEGIKLAIAELNIALDGTTLGQIMQVTVYAGLGVYAIKKVL